jgi:hypothetical protein
VAVVPESFAEVADGMDSRAAEEAEGVRAGMLHALARAQHDIVRQK